MKKEFFALATAILCSIVVSFAQPHPKSAADTRKAVHAFADQKEDAKKAEIRIAKHVAEMKVRLALSDKQAAEMTNILTKAQKDRMKEAQARRAQAEKDRAQAKAKRGKIQKEIDAVLTTEQKAQWDELRAENRGKNVNGVPLKGMVRRGPQTPPQNAGCASCGCDKTKHHQGADNHKMLKHPRQPRKGGAVAPQTNKVETPVAE